MGLITLGALAALRTSWTSSGATEGATADPGLGERAATAPGTA
jgi:hypothetical protein